LDSGSPEGKKESSPANVQAFVWVGKGEEPRVYKERQGDTLRGKKARPWGQKRSKEKVAARGREIIKDGVSIKFPEAQGTIHQTIFQKGKKTSRWSTRREKKKPQSTGKTKPHQDERVVVSRSSLGEKKGGVAASL